MPRMAEHDHPDHGHDHGRRSIMDRIRHALAHDHDHDHGPPLSDTGAEGVRAAKVSLVALGVTAAAQAVLVAFTGSVALLSDTVHNLTDALTAIPLWIAFALGRRARSSKYPYGLGRAEDLAGLVILVAIAASAGAVAWESIGRLVEPRVLDHVGWVIAAGFIGAAGNELVARYRIRVGRRISSAALIADGQHARADALTSLAVVAAGLGSWAGADWMDPVAGLVVAAMILAMLRTASARVLGRFLDAVDPEYIDRAEKAALAVIGVSEVGPTQIRWSGHRLLVTITAAVDPVLSVAEGHRIGEEVAHSVIHAFESTTEVLVHVDPAGIHDAHGLTDHHRA